MVVSLPSPCRRAKLLLKKKRYREQLLDRTENQISSLEAMVGSGREPLPGTRVLMERSQGVGHPRVGGGDQVRLARVRASWFAPAGWSH